MLDKDKLERVASSWKKADSNSFTECYTMLVNEFMSIQQGLLTSNDFGQIRFLQGAGTIIMILISAMEKTAKIDYNFSDSK